ncbi:nuclear transport factor 2 family protein [Rhodoferax ferrireducens]|uniref:nuclear transport factor 2 family protein n=1 Tax=Rhodoferax ferrireducens TaxID=192843 RepID=UPI0013004DBD|nr:nuclear transport factor 2 family protein [Rhodoferax ferrireducens]
MTRTGKKLGLLVAALALPCLFVSSALAGPLDEAKAQVHLNAVAAGDLDALMRAYPEDAYMDWVGGPLDGRYRGKTAIEAVWQKFIALNAGKPRPVKLSKLEAYANAKGTTVEVKAEYGGTPPVKVLHLLTYRDGDLATEIWQIAPAIQLTP